MLQRRRFITASLLLGTPALHAQPGDFWATLRAGGHIVLMRHAITEPGVGDPPDLRLGECRTQRNLSDLGREQARRVGAAFGREGVRVDAVRSSAWCRCVDTAQLAFGAHAVWAPLNSFFGGQGAREAQTRAVLAEVRTLPAGATWVYVTHQVNITALTGETLAMGELFATRPDASGERLQVIARHVP
ncbi:MAG: histidine phosphatase family protein [Hydrogenophaga sp.]|uniref:histidine phosphatase family protein n=1 Tax=Hydrogenophaga sp. TaxID=1904254 RepID=UPI001DFB136A|nr:histidine phosphatase family protein [Hydrogenophaga sp.]MBX3610472.1 histidine phosphatase family protein [Hydrogenophaga sp.]